MSAASGELTFVTARAQLAALDGQPGPLDLAQVPRADSAGISLLLELTRRAATRGEKLAIVNANAQVRSLAEFFGVDSALNLS